MLLLELLLGGTEELAGFGGAAATDIAAGPPTMFETELLERLEETLGTLQEETTGELLAAMHAVPLKTVVVDDDAAIEEEEEVVVLDSVEFPMNLPITVSLRSIGIS